jgi:hypothetical protein
MFAPIGQRECSTFDLNKQALVYLYQELRTGIERLVMVQQQAPPAQQQDIAGHLNHLGGAHRALPFFTVGIAFCCNLGDRRNGDN